MCRAMGSNSEFVLPDDKCYGRVPVDINTTGRGLDNY
jgi:hypothetical protein